MNNPYRPSQQDIVRARARGLRFLDDSERDFWEHVVCALESCDRGSSETESVAKRADHLVLLRRERLAETP
jgi:hypothetical protein